MLASCSSRGSPLVTKATTGQKRSGTAAGTRRGSTVIPVGKPGAKEVQGGGGSPVKLLTNVEKLRLLTKAEKSGLLSAAEGLGLSLSAVEKLGLLSKAEEFGVLSAATDPGTPGALQGLSLALLAAGPLCAYVVPEQSLWQVVLQVTVVAVSVLGGSAAFAASTFVSNLQKSG
ncbi:wiskott-aldrich syndrome family protein, putative (DUF1118) [Wolffia australiana]